MSSIPMYAVQFDFYIVIFGTYFSFLLFIMSKISFLHNYKASWLLPRDLIGCILFDYKFRQLFHEVLWNSFFLNLNSEKSLSTDLSIVSLLCT